MSRSPKGSPFEREMCRTLSKWWTGDKRDDVFWRSSTSGAMATVRSRSNKRTHGHYGDVSATDPIGAPLLDLCAIELKRGYNHIRLDDFLQKKSRTKTEVNAWIEQAHRSAEMSGSFSWLIIHKQDRKDPVVYLPDDLAAHLPELSFFGVIVSVGFATKAHLVSVRLEEFLMLKPSYIRELSKSL